MPDAPHYCLSLYATAELQAFGYFKAIGISERRTSSITESLYRSDPIVRGACRTPLVADLVRTAPGVLTYGQVTAITARLGADPKALTVATTPPTGSMTIAIGNSTCTAQLSAETASSSTGACSLVLNSVGPAVPLTISYGGNSMWAPITGGASLSVARAPTVIGMSSTPNVRIPLIADTHSKLIADSVPGDHGHPQWGA